MVYSAAEIESIVRRVLTQLTDSAAQGSTKETNSPGVYPLAGKVISVETFRSLPLDAKAIRIGHKSLVTPAAIDWLKERRVDIDRGEFSSGTSPQQAPISVVGRAEWLPKLAKQVCSKQAIISLPAIDDSAALLEAKGEIRRGRKIVLMIADHSHASCWQAARDEMVRPVVVHDWKQLQSVLQEVPANLLIVQHNEWNPYSLTNAVRKTFERISQRDGSLATIPSSPKPGSPLQAANKIGPASVGGKG